MPVLVYSEIMIRNSKLIHMFEVCVHGCVPKIIELCRPNFFFDIVDFKIPWRRLSKEERV